MGQPTPGDAHVNGPLTNISIAWLQTQSNFVATQAFPVVPVEKQSDLYYEFDRNDFFRDEAKPRAPATESAGGGFKLSQTTYSANVEAYHKDIDDQLRANADTILQLDRAGTEFVSLKMAIRRERRWTTGFFGTGIWGTDVTPSPLWSVGATATPQKDVETGKMAIQSATGFKPNTMIVGSRVNSALKTCQEVRDQFKYTSADSIDETMLARFFGIDRYMVASGVWQSANEGATAVFDFIQGKHALLCYVNPAPSIMMPSAGYTFAWRGLVGSGGDGVRIKKFRMEQIEADRVEGEMAFDMKVVAAALGYFFNSAVA